MALDEPTDNDEVVSGDEYQLMADKELLDKFGGLTVDYVKMAHGEGFSIKAGNGPDKDACGSCSC